MDCVLYARISSDRTGQEAGVTRQMEDTRELATRHRDRVIAEIIDNDVSAFSRKPRPGYAQVVDLVKAGTVQAVYVWHPDRLYRRLRDLEDLVDLVDAHNLTIRTVRAGDIDLATSTGRMTARVIGSVAQHESEQKADRQARKHRELAKAGKLSGGGKRPLGYRDDRVTIDEKEAAALRRAADAIIAGTSLAEATRQVSAELGRPVRTTGLKGALTGHRIVGMRSYIPAADRRRGVTKGTVSAAVWPAVLDEVTWRKVRAILLDPRRVKARPPRRYLLTGLLHCGKCGKPLAGGKDAYRCDEKHDGCARLGVTAAPVDRIVEAFVRKLVDTPSVRRKLTASPARKTTGPDVEQLTARLATLAEMFADEQMSADEWRAARDRIRDRIGQRQVHDAESVAAKVRAERIESVLADWDAAELPEQRSVVAAVLDSADLAVVIEARSKRNGCRFDPDRVRIVPRAEVAKRRKRWLRQVAADRKERTA